jgi:hypothetical protein
VEGRESVTCGLTSANTIYCWGLSVGGNESTECQNGLPRNDCARTPILQAGGATWPQMLITGGMICGRAASGVVTCWGFSFWGEFGNGVEYVNTTTPTAIAGGAAFAQTVGGRTHLCARETDGSVKCWGDGNYSSGEGGNPSRLTPTAIAGGITFSTLWGGTLTGNTCGLSVAGRAYCWGDGRFGQIGDGAALTRLQPALVKLVR